MSLTSVAPREICGRFSRQAKLESFGALISITRKFFTFYHMKVIKVPQHAWYPEVNYTIASINEQLRQSVTVGNKMPQLLSSDVHEG